MNSLKKSAVVNYLGNEIYVFGGWRKVDAIFDTAIFDGEKWKSGPKLLHNRGQHR